ncbi:unnamed protein product, partial [Brenthis ino]
MQTDRKDENMDTATEFLLALIKYLKECHPEALKGFKAPQGPLQELLNQPNLKSRSRSVTPVKPAPSVQSTPAPLVQPSTSAQPVLTAQKPQAHSAHPAPSAQPAPPAHSAPSVQFITPSKPAKRAATKTIIDTTDHDMETLREESDSTEDGFIPVESKKRKKKALKANNPATTSTVASLTKPSEHTNKRTDERQTPKTDDSVPRTKPPPPTFVQDKKSWNNVLTQMSARNINFNHAKSTGQGIKVRSLEVLAELSSDHRPVLLQLGHDVEDRSIKRTITDWKRLRDRFQTIDTAKLNITTDTVTSVSAAKEANTKVLEIIKNTVGECSRECSVPFEGRWPLPEAGKSNESRAAPSTDSRHTFDNIIGEKLTIEPNCTYASQIELDL